MVKKRRNTRTLLRMCQKEVAIPTRVDGVTPGIVRRWRACSRVLTEVGSIRIADGGTPRQLYTKLVEVFGANRIMWSSNYPAHPKFGGMKERLEVAKEELAFLSEEVRAWIFGKTAVSFYPALR